ncbi:hypothetical protein KQH82_08840 [bacterium]|nr:hypothetical protein [bacterium]
MTKRLFVVAAAALALACSSSETGKDVVVDQTASIEVPGVFSGTVTQTQYYAEGRQAVHTMVEMSSPTMTGDSTVTQENSTIIRLDKGVMWLLPPEGDSSYVEMPLGSIRSNFERMRQQFASLDTSGGASPGVKLFTNSHWSVVVNDSVEQKTINGFPCQKMEILITGSSDQLATDSVFLKTDVWYSRDFPQAEMIIAETRSVMDALGVDPNWLANILLSFFGQMAHAFSDVADEINSLDGVPIQTSIVMEAATTSDPTAQTSDSLSQQDMVSIVLSLARMYAQATSMPAPTGHFQMLSMTSEVTAVRNESVDSLKFEIPEGYMPQQMPGMPGGAAPQSNP